MKKSLCPQRKLFAPSHFRFTINSHFSVAEGCFSAKNEYSKIFWRKNVFIPFQYYFRKNYCPFISFLMSGAPPFFHVALKLHTLSDNAKKSLYMWWYFRSTGSFPKLELILKETQITQNHTQSATVRQGPASSKVHTKNKISMIFIGFYFAMMIINNLILASKEFWNIY